MKPILWQTEATRKRRSKPEICWTVFDWKKKTLGKKIWREDLAQPRGDPQTKLAKFFTLTTLSRIISRKLPVEFGFYGLTRALFLNPLFIPTYTESHWPAGHQRLLTDLFPAFAYATERKRRKNPVNRWPFSSPRFPVHEVTRVSTCLVMMDWTVWKGWRGLERVVLDCMELDAKFWTKFTMNWTLLKWSERDWGWVNWTS